MNVGVEGRLKNYKPASAFTGRWSF